MTHTKHQNEWIHRIHKELPITCCAQKSKTLIDNEGE